VENLSYMGDKLSLPLFMPLKNPAWGTIAGVFN
jgi:hypothetical protein